MIVVRPEGFEPPTVRVEAGYSIQLSYGRVTVLSYYEKCQVLLITSCHRKTESLS